MLAGTCLRHDVSRHQELTCAGIVSTIEKPPCIRLSMSEGTQKTVAEHIRQILARLLKVERHLESLDSPIPAQGTGDLGPPLDREVVAHVLELETRLTQIEDENRELAGLCSRLNEQNEAISNLYVAKHRLQASLDAGEIMKIVTELVGAGTFSIMFVDQKKKILRRVASRGRRMPRKRCLSERACSGRSRSKALPSTMKRRTGKSGLRKSARGDPAQSGKAVRGRDLGLPASTP